MKRDPKVERIEQLIEPVIERESLELVDVELIREAIGLVLRILVDSKEDGISLDRLAKISQSVGAILDESGIVTQKYTLEVSSPGIERPLKKPEHFKRFVGSNISVKTEKPIGKRRQFKGRLLEADDKGFVIEVEGENFEIDYDNVAKARLQVELEF
ncbi:MAG: ribosome maturation factor RimP [Candidatus Aquicultor secundus]|uniref:Ribosome maturation factor RimP n=1 Tax=Candidatus Aquicultor secundus TaxID=1973895 RepID=A0A2M7T6V6_9ACTN|nr:ribosome maturation factor RimP [Candidatus Aquicultor secundus]NCO65573.1 ribosome maturation factor RimP [Solirubrobacter sp.]OIO88952.1 MAG: hypothetical protein AUK32_00210 [Candidatus Aquicultor secundus]PIU26178.1 MAG: ribosome maturation factor RimP [Candidatus Aquicultor secundus]PIW22806.1 MAG: ribosome maturation factor RimP [Candidatus Aquicultor secundus]PIX51444.1 MAG: ribosome maturation factor RimP [Candidatus Aquicultor secundus]